MKRTPATSDLSAQDLLDSITESLDLLDGFEGMDLPAEPLPSLLEQCAAMVAQQPEAVPLRSIHHMACSGGTLIAKCLSLMPNVTLLSEIDPLSGIGLPQPGTVPPFRPFDLIYGGRVALRKIDDTVARRVFTAGLSELHKALTEQGRALCLRDHAHSQFCTKADPLARPSLRTMMADVAPLLSVVTVRHPLDAFLSLQRNGWVHFQPDTIDEYARRYMLFLDAHAGIEIRRYEDFVADPEAVLQDICTLLDLPFQSGFEPLLSAVMLSGDSGRSSNRIAPRARRAVSDLMIDQARSSDCFTDLCDRLGYDGV